MIRYNAIVQAIRGLLNIQRTPESLTFVDLKRFLGTISIYKNYKSMINLLSPSQGRGVGAVEISQQITSSRAATLCRQKNQVRCRHGDADLLLLECSGFTLKPKPTNAELSQHGGNKQRQGGGFGGTRSDNLQLEKIRIRPRTPSPCIFPLC